MYYAESRKKNVQSIAKALEGEYKPHIPYQDFPALFPFHFVKERYARGKNTRELRREWFLPGIEVAERERRAPSHPGYNFIQFKVDHFLLRMVDFVYQNPGDDNFAEMGTITLLASPRKMFPAFFMRPRRGPYFGIMNPFGSHRELKGILRNYHVEVIGKNDIGSAFNTEVREILVTNRNWTVEGRADGLMLNLPGGLVKPTISEYKRRFEKLLALGRAFEYGPDILKL